jgi:uncharacterized membrane protein YdfJ with MMPL/SSD domain
VEQETLWKKAKSRRVKYGLATVVAAVLALAACAIQHSGIKWDYTTPTTPTYSDGIVGALSIH